MNENENFLKVLFTAIDENCKLISIDDFEADDNFVVSLRTKLADNFGANCKEWVEKFSNQTRSKYFVRRTFPNGQRMNYRVVYYCKKNKLKNCVSKIDMKVKISTESTLKKDPLLKEGYNTLIKVNFQHNHDR